MFISALEVGISLVGFREACGGEKSIFPDGGAITRLQTPVALRFMSAQEVTVTVER